MESPIKSDNERFRKVISRQIFERDQFSQTDEITSTPDSDSLPINPDGKQNGDGKSSQSASTKSNFVVMATIVVFISVALAYVHAQNYDSLLPKVTDSLFCHEFSVKLSECQSQNTGLSEELGDCRNRNHILFDKIESEAQHDIEDASTIEEEFQKKVPKKIFIFGVASMNAILSFPVVRIIIENLMRIRLNKWSNPFIVRLYDVFTVGAWCLSARLVWFLNSRHEISSWESCLPIFVFILLKGFTNGLILDPQTPILGSSSRSAIAQSQSQSVLKVKARNAQ